MAYCRKHQTDGVIALGVLQGFRYYKPVRATELATPYKPGVMPLWETIEGGFKVHDYLEWNPSKDEEVGRRTDSKERMRSLRESRGSPPVSTNRVLTRESGSRDVPDRIGSDPDRKKEVCADALAERAGRLREELYPAWYAKWRHGAKLRLVANALEFQDAMSLVATWDDARLEQLARIVLTTDDDFISTTDRGFHIFAIKASWAENRLCEVEKGNK